MSSLGQRQTVNSKHYKQHRDVVKGRKATEKNV